MQRRTLTVLGVAWLAAAVLAAAVLATGCGSTTSSGGGSTPAASESPKKGGTLTLSYESEPPTLDPAIAWNVIDWAIEHNIYESFYRYAPKPGAAGTELVPAIAAAMPTVSADGKTFTIPLKHGVKFAPPVNREVTAEDFKYSFERMMRLPLAPATYFYTGVVGAKDYQAGKAKEISGFKVLDKYTVQITLEQPDLSFLKALTMEFTDVVPKEWVEKWGDKKFGRHPLGTGPFYLTKWVPGREIVLARNPNYRDTVWLDGVTYAMSFPPQTAFLKLQRGEVDILGDNLPPADIPRMMADPQWKQYVATQPKIAVMYFFMNVNFKPFDSVAVRRALSWAIDRDKLVKLLAGQARPLYQVYPPGMPGYQADKKWYGYDPAKAKQLLAEAGYPNGFTTTLYTDNVDPDPKLTQSIQNDLAAVGVKSSIKTMSNDAYYTLGSTPTKLSAGLSVWYMDFPDPADWIVPLFSKSNAVEGGMNWSFWWDPKLETMLADAQQMTDAQARIAKYEEMQAFIMDQAPYVTLYSPIMTTMFSKNVGGFYMHEVYDFDVQNFWRK
jgi:oligopeptide transport system substrate-binding protein